MIKKMIVGIFKTLFFIILILNLVILFSGRWYLWKGLWNTYREQKVRGQFAVALCNSVFHNQALRGS